jgi:hypothetical protein
MYANVSLCLRVCVCVCVRVRACVGFTLSDRVCALYARVYVSLCVFFVCVFVYLCVGYIYIMCVCLYLCWSVPMRIYVYLLKLT